MNNPAHDPYVIPGTLTLNNKLGIRDREELGKISNAFALLRLRQGMPHPEVGEEFSLAHLQNVHHHLFQDTYEWAGQARDCRLAIGEVEFCPPERIESEMKLVHRDLERRAYFIDCDKGELAQEMASLYSRLNWIHPFRDGNGRATRTMLEDLARANSYHLDWSQTNKVEWNQACYMAASQGNQDGLRDVFAKVVVELPMELRTNASATLSEQSDQEQRTAELMNQVISEFRDVVLSGDYLDEIRTYDGETYDIPDDEAGRTRAGAGPGPR